MDIIRQNVDSITKHMLEKPKPDSKRLPSLVPANISLLVVSKVIPTKKLIRLELSCRIEEPSVCLLVKDTDKRDYNRSVNAWKLRWKTDLAKAGRIQSSLVPTPTFLPLRELKLAYQTYASKRRLAATFDVFLADRRIVHHLPTKLGKPFYGEVRGKLPVPVDLAKGNLVRTVAGAINTVLFSVRGIGTSESVPIGTMQLTLDQIKANILSVCEQLCTEWPGGGLDNIRSIYIQVPEANIPIFYDPSEPSLDLLVSSMTTTTVPGSVAVAAGTAEHSKLDGGGAVAGVRKPTTKALTMDLINRVIDDLPLPRGGLEEVFAAQRKPILPKRVGAAGQQKKKLRKSVKR